MERRHVDDAGNGHQDAGADLEPEVLLGGEPVGGVSGKVGGRLKDADRPHELCDGVADGEVACGVGPAEPRCNKQEDK